MGQCQMCKCGHGHTIIDLTLNHVVELCLDCLFEIEPEIKMAESEREETQILTKYGIGG